LYIEPMQSRRKKDSRMCNRSFVVAVLLLSVFSCAPTKWQADIHYVATPQAEVEAMLRLADVNESDIVYDLGCGDGRFVITAAKEFGARGVGVDIDPFLVKKSVQNARDAGVSDRVKFIEGDLFESPIREATVVTLYLYPDLNVKLRPKLLSELKPGSRVVSYFFDMGDWKPDRTEARQNRIYYWIIPEHVGGDWEWSIDSDPEAPDALRLQQKYQEIKGRIRFKGTEAELLKANLEGDRLRFEFLSVSWGWPVRMMFEGRITGEKIVGTVEVEGGPLRGTHSWSAKKLPSRASEVPPTLNYPR
jgi:SAM-dependent methyltransferase